MFVASCCSALPRPALADHTANFFNELWNRQSNITKINKFRVVDGDHDWPVWRSTIGEAMT